MPTPSANSAIPERLRGQDAIITPHEGEFSRLFGEIAGIKAGARARSRAQVAARSSSTRDRTRWSPSPDGRLGFAPPAPAWLASAGTGDVLAGMIAAMRARGLRAVRGGMAAVWLHGRAAEIAGPHMIADDLAAAIPAARL